MQKEATKISKKVIQQTDSHKKLSVLEKLRSTIKSQSKEPRQNSFDSELHKNESSSSRLHGSIKKAVFKTHQIQNKEKAEGKQTKLKKKGKMTKIEKLKSEQNIVQIGKMKIQEIQPRSRDKQIRLAKKKVKINNDESVKNTLHFKSQQKSKKILQPIQKKPETSIILCDNLNPQSQNLIQQPLQTQIPFEHQGHQYQNLKSNRSLRLVKQIQVNIQGNLQQKNRLISEVDKYRRQCLQLQQELRAKNISTKLMQNDIDNKSKYLVQKQRDILQKEKSIKQKQLKLLQRQKELVESNKNQIDKHERIDSRAQSNASSSNATSESVIQASAANNNVTVLPGQAKSLNYISSNYSQFSQTSNYTPLRQQNSQYQIKQQNSSTFTNAPQIQTLTSNIKYIYGAPSKNQQNYSTNYISSSTSTSQPQIQNQPIVISANSGLKVIRVGRDYSQA